MGYAVMGQAARSSIMPSFEVAPRGNKLVAVNLPSSGYIRVDAMTLEQALEAVQMLGAELKQVYMDRLGMDCPDGA